MQIIFKGHYKTVKYEIIRAYFYPTTRLQKGYLTTYRVEI